MINIIGVFKWGEDVDEYFGKEMCLHLISNTCIISYLFDAFKFNLKLHYKLGLNYFLKNEWNINGKLYDIKKTN